MGIEREQKNTYTPNNKLPGCQLKGVKAKAKTWHLEGICRNRTGTIHTACCENWETKDKDITYKCTWGLHRNASAGISSVWPSESSGSCDFKSILDHVTFFTPGCWAAFAWCFATHTVGGLWDGPTGVLYKHNTVSVTLKMQNIQIRETKRTACSNDRMSCHESQWNFSDIWFVPISTRSPWILACSWFQKIT